MKKHLVLNDNGYLVYDVNTDKFTIFLRNSDLILGKTDHTEIVLNELQKGEAYYVKAVVNQGSPVKLVAMNRDKARSEIKNTVLYDQDEKIIKLYESQSQDASAKPAAKPIADPRVAPAAAAVTGSSADEIQKLYELKKSGAISDEEFQSLKKKVIEQK